MGTQILNSGPGSDGDGRKWPKHTYDRNDDYFLDRIGAEWIKDLPGGPQPGVTYRLNRLPTGYAGFQKPRADSKHVDRYIYGHPDGQFRSIVEFYPHFKHLMETGGPAGCTCVRCTGSARKPKNPPAERRSKYFAPPSGVAGSASTTNVRQNGVMKKGRFNSEDYELPKRRDVDLEGTPDIYERLIQRLKDAGPEATVDEMIEERMSPDWRAANAQSIDTLNAMRQLPAYVPRIGEVVMFVRSIREDARIAWDAATNVFRRVDVGSRSWQEPPKWEAGVITQTPEEEISEEDLVTDLHKKQSIIYSGFRIEPLSEPGNLEKPYSRQHKHVPLCAIRPFALWQDCLRGVSENDRHPTIKHALSMTSSVCAIGRYRFKGSWPSASIFCRGLYLGSELILVGDTVRLLPKAGEQKSNAVTEVMVITSIRLRFVNLDFDDDDLAPTVPALPYQTAIHVVGKVYTTDPSRSFNGMSKQPIDPKSGLLPPAVDGYGPWYHYSNPEEPKARVEVPFSRIFSRCHEHSAMHILFANPKDVKSEMQPSAFKAVNAPNGAIDSLSANVNLLSKGLPGIKDARSHSRAHDPRLTGTEQLWFWADARIEQLDLHEVNGRFVGARDPMRTKEQLRRWQKVLKGLDGKKGALEEYEAAKKQQAEREKAALQGVGGMMGSAAAVDTEMESGGDEDGDEGGDEEQGEEMEVDEDVEESGPPPTQAQDLTQTKPQSGTIDLMDSESEEEMAQNQLVGELFKNIRPGGSKG